VIAANNPEEYPVIVESRVGDNTLGVILSPRTVAYVTTRGFPFPIFILLI